MGFYASDHISNELLGDFPGDGYGWTTYELPDGYWREERDDDEEPIEQPEWAEGHEYDHTAKAAEITEHYYRTHPPRHGQWQSYYVAPDGAFFTSVFRAAVHQDEQLGGM